MTLPFLTLLICCAITILWLPLLFGITRVPYDTHEERALLDLFRRHVNARINRMNAEARAKLARKKGAYR
jgi:hypothetical protein